MPWKGAKSWKWGHWMVFFTILLGLWLGSLHCGLQKLSKSVNSKYFLKWFPLQGALGQNPYFPLTSFMDEAEALNKCVMIIETIIALEKFNERYWKCFDSYIKNANNVVRRCDAKLDPCWHVYEFLWVLLFGSSGQCQNVFFLLS